MRALERESAGARGLRALGRGALAGVAYGFGWWLLGPLTLLPILLGGSPQWTVAAAAALFPSLVGASRVRRGARRGLPPARGALQPVVDHPHEAEAIRAEARRAQLFGSAPALWALIATVAVTVPLLLSG